MEWKWPLDLLGADGSEVGAEVVFLISVTEDMTNVFCGGWRITLLLGLYIPGTETVASLTSLNVMHTGHVTRHASRIMRYYAERRRCEDG